MKLSVCLSSIRMENLSRIYSSLLESVKDESFELIIVTPFGVPENVRNEKNVRIITDHGCPTRCLQIGADQADGDLFMWGSDDGVFAKGAIKESVDLYDKLCSKSDAIVMRYTEGYGMPTYTKAHSNPKYWRAPSRWVDNNRKKIQLKGISTTFLWGLLLIDLQYFREVGGFDCSMEHPNYSLHDLCYRLQGNGSKFYLSPSFFLNCDWNPKSDEYKIIHEANAHDFDIFKSIWKAPTNRFKLNFDNWENAPASWRRFS